MVVISPERSYRKMGIDTGKYPPGYKEYQRRWSHVNKQRKEAGQ